MNSVLKAAGYILAHTPDMVIHNGTTQTTERVVNPDSEYLKVLKDHLRTYDEVVKYPPNQAYIGNITPYELSKYAMPWHDKEAPDASKYGKFGEIMPQEEFIGLMQICDVFDLVKLEKNFASLSKNLLIENKLISSDLVGQIKEGEELDTIMKFIEEEHAEPLYNNGEVVGCVKNAHDVDTNLSAHVLFENLVSKASCAFSIINMLDKNNINKDDIDYVIDCCEEACGDMNQRGGGNFAKAAAEIAGLNNATGSDVRGFCAGPAHAMVHAAALVKSGTFKNVIVCAGGSTAKLGMNGKDHVKKGMPILEDMVAGFAVLVSENDGESPEIRNDIVGRHTVGTGSSPQAVISSLVSEPLEKAGMKITDIQKYSAEMQNPDITKPAGAGDVPNANYKMIGALAVKMGNLDRKELPSFIEKHGMVGWAPTQGHIPSGVPYLGFAREDIMAGTVKNAMIVGKGSLFLGRMTNLFDGISFVIEENQSKKFQGLEEDEAVDVKIPKIAITTIGSEHGEKNVIEGALKAIKSNISVTTIGSESSEGLKHVKTDCEKEAHELMENLLDSKKVDGAVTMHYPFPIGVSTVGRVITPEKGREMFIATTTGTSSADRVEGMVKNAIYGIITAKACGIKKPTVGIANVDGARQVEIALKTLKEKGYDINFAQSDRADGGVVMRGNDLMTASADVMVTDSLTGNLLIKMFSAYNSGGKYESVGYGYGPGIGKDFNKLIMIISRASGAPVIEGAIKFAAELVNNNVHNISKEEFAKVEKAGYSEVLQGLKKSKPQVSATTEENVEAPEKEVVTEQISGVDVMDLEDAVKVLWKNKIYAESGMGCTGPIVLVSPANVDKSRALLIEAKFISE
ncbi:MAG: glycine/sarcosine/betaine reductase complex component C subunit beta [Terrisporobacter othiniensis]|uniref:glycine/sarcosine/betaine reductase complex component C subunit beta n=1 Tax=Terrisporobacter petrolearius TaxID=1460447 RepID=UPI0022E53C33|nr:glycine/sarcosine/betaine reductase complex component C subunit beta [Terrisporobacter petrolearius]MDU4860575.1 glycine/sarcosine/betaine reductase complex component C subunit beta [Terrisporobacter othiniensis]MDU6994434.1 glycine/sarcosine/betaine reductase complex component C subunit beta [Terrisporobacter othiniensis]